MQKRSFYRTWTSDIPVTGSGCIRIRVTGASLFCWKIWMVLHPRKRHTCHWIRMHSISLGFWSTGKSHTLVTRYGFCLLLVVEPWITAHEKRDTCDKIRICSNSRYFDFEIDPDRVTGVSLLCWKIRILLHPKKRHACDRIRMESNFRNSQILFCLLACLLVACLLLERCFWAFSVAQKVWKFQSRRFASQASVSWRVLLNSWIRKRKK